MDRVTFVGDELSAAGWRLAGLEVAVPEPGQESAAFAAARDGAALVLISAEHAARLPREELTAAIAAGSPPVLVVPDVARRALPADLAAQLRAQLGMEP